MGNRRRPDVIKTDETTAAQMIQVVNIAWGRRLHNNRGFIEAIADARDAGYTYDHMRVVVWSAACARSNDRDRGAAWIKREMTMQGGLYPEIMMRFKGGPNQETGVNAIRWLDVLFGAKGEINPVMVKELLERIRSVNPALADDELAMLVRNKIEIGEHDEDVRAEEQR